MAITEAGTGAAGEPGNAPGRTGADGAIDNNACYAPGNVLRALILTHHHKAGIITARPISQRSRLKPDTVRSWLRLTQAGEW